MGEGETLAASWRNVAGSWPVSRSKWNKELPMNPENIQHSTFNAQHRRNRTASPLNVERWALNVECFFMVQGFNARTF